MAAAPQKLMTVEEFLEWYPEDGLHYDLIDGVPIAHAAPTAAHGSVALRFGAAIDACLRAKRLPCRVEVTTGVRPERRARWNYFEPDVVVRGGASRREASEPVLVVEVISPSNRHRDTLRKVAGYKSLPSILAIIHAEQDEHLSHIEQRVGDTRIAQDLAGPEDSVRIDALGIEFRLAEVYEDVDVAGAPPEQSEGAAE